MDELEQHGKQLKNYTEMNCLSLQIKQQNKPDPRSELVSSSRRNAEKLERMSGWFWTEGFYLRLQSVQTPHGSEPALPLTVRRVLTTTPLYHYTLRSNERGNQKSVCLDVSGRTLTG